MPSGDFLEVTKKLIRDFNKRQKEYHTTQQQYEQENQAQKGGIEKDINLALQNLRNRGALELQRGQQQFEAPLQQAQIGRLNQDTKSNAFDLRLGMDYSGGLLQQKLQEGSLIQQQLRKLLEGPSTTGATSSVGETVNLPPNDIGPVLPIKEPTNILNFLPISLRARAGREGYQLGQRIGQYIRRNFRIGTDIFQ